MADETDQERIDFPDYPPMDETGMVDLWQIEESLSLTPAQRMRRFEEFLIFSYALRKAGMKLHGDISETDPEAA